MMARRPRLDPDWDENVSFRICSSSIIFGVVVSAGHRFRIRTIIGGAGAGKQSHV